MVPPPQSRSVANLVLADRAAATAWPVCVFALLSGPGLARPCPF